MEEEKSLSQQESLQLITEMIGKAKNHFHESGTSAILWGSVIGVAGLVSFAEMHWHFDIGFDIWLIVLAAIIPQVFLIIREARNRKVVTHTEAAIDAAWMAYGISIFALIFYFNIVPGVTDRWFAQEGITLTQAGPDHIAKPFHTFIPSYGSLLLLLYAIPTLTTGVAGKFKPMFWAAILCYLFFILSCFTPVAYDMLLNGLAGIFNWLIPGLILRRKYYRHQKALNVQRS
ncbi:MAG: hypothetical protein ABW019_08000 [Chitinophagaceae bacterium]